MGLDNLVRHFRGRDVSDLIGLHTTSPDNHSRWLALDIDNHSENEKDRHRRNRKAAFTLYKRLKGLGFDPLLVSSNGRGGYHLLVLFKKPVPTPEVFAFGRWLARDWKQLGLAEPPEMFPKQAKLDEKTKYGNLLRLPGRHHTLSYYSQVWNGKNWTSGEAAIQVILNTKGKSSQQIPPEALQVEPDEDDQEAGDDPVVPPVALAQIQKRALALLRKKLKAVQGKNGDKTTWTAALYLVKDFALTVDQALPVFSKWNDTHCKPSWPEEKLLRKLELAEQQPGRRGRLLDGVLNANKPLVKPSTATVATGEPFALNIPDFTLADWRKVMPRVLPSKRGRFSTLPRIVWGLFLAAVIRQGSSAIWIPDVTVAQLLWGGDRSQWPPRWRRQLERRFRRRYKVWNYDPECSPECPLHDHPDVPHGHLWIKAPNPEKDLGCLHFFWIEHDKANDIYEYNFRGLKSHHPSESQAETMQTFIDHMKKKGCLCSVYLPAWVLAPAVLPPGPTRILQAMTRELTRQASGSSQRADRAEVVSGTVSPLLDKDRRYVGFNGNGRKTYRGRGYRLATWMKRAGYAVPEDALDWHEVRRFLRDLRSLGKPFGLTPVAVRDGSQQAESIERLQAMARTPAGRSWLKKCRLMLYGPEDYLSVWRQHFAEKLGVSFIPGGTSVVQTDTKVETDSKITSALELDAWMQANGLTDRALAGLLGVSPALVSYQHSGKRPWSASFQQRLAKYLATTGK